MFAGKMRILLLLFLWDFTSCAVPANTTTSTSPPNVRDRCNLRPLEASIFRLESQFEEKVNLLRRDISASSSTIQYQNRGIQAAVGDCKNDIGRLVERVGRYNSLQSTENDQSLDQKLDDLSRKLQLTVATIRLVNSDLATIRQNLSDVVNITSSILDKMEIQSDIQSIFKITPDQPSPTPQFQTNPKNCKEIKRISPNSPSGIYLVQPDTSKPPFMVFCDMVIQDGGWLTIHSRYEGSQDFYLGWQDYKLGFGNIAGEFWLGLEKMYQLTGNQVNELLIEVVDTDKIKSIAHYAYFSIGSEEEGYPLKVLGGYKGNAGDSLSYQAGSKFSTKDRDNDSWSEGSCAQSHSGAWWYKECDKSNLNGKYIPGQQEDQFLYQAMYWGEVPGPQEGLLEARMLIRPSEGINAVAVPDSV